MIEKEADIYQKITKMTHMTNEMQNKLLRQMSRVSIQEKIRILEAHNTIFYTLKSKNSDLPNEELSLAALYLAINKVLAKDLTRYNAAQLIERKQKLKSKQKRNKVISHWAVVKTLRAQNMSYRDIAVYFNKHLRIVVSYSFIYQICNELEHT